MDILFFLFITIFFIFKMKKVIGSKEEDSELRQKAINEFLKQRNELNKNNTKEAKIIDIREKLNLKNTEEKAKNKKETQKTELKLSLDIPEKTKKELIKINFNEKNFLKGSENVIEMITDSFSKQDIETLKTLLTTRIFKNFHSQIEELQKEEKMLKSSLISFLSNKIENIKIEDKKIIIQTEIETEQINFIENKDKQIIFGDKKKIERIKEKWLFEREINSKNNFWLVQDIFNID